MTAYSDLVIDGIICDGYDGTNQASATGVADAVVLISAYSSSLPVTYSLDGVNYQPGVFFNNLKSGNYTLYVQDGTGNVVTRQFFVPIKFSNLTTSSVSGSRWAAVFNPIVFNYQRKDADIVSFTSTSVTNNKYSGLALQVTLNVQLDTVAIANILLNPVHIVAPGYDFWAIPNDAALTNNNSQTAVYFYQQYFNDNDTTGAYANFRTGHKFITEITYGYDGNNQVMTASHAANLKGQCRADISKYLRALLIPKDDFDYSTINYRDANISASYTVRYSETWEGITYAQQIWKSAGDPFYVTYSAMQVGNKTGGDMQPFVTYPNAIQSNPARFLNDFRIPHLYTDMPFDLSFIYSEKILGYQIKLGGNGIDINGNVSGALGELMLLNENGSVLLNQDGSKLLIEKQAPGVLTSKLGVNRVQIKQPGMPLNIPANSIWLDVFLFYTDNNNNVIKITEDKRLLIDNSPCNGLSFEYLKWIGPTGGWMYYMLVKNQLHDINTANPVIMERIITDYAAADSTQQLISISAQKKITAGKNDVPAEEMEALSTILYSPKVYRLINAATNTWQGVIVDTKSLKMYQTYGNTGDFEISYLLPQINTQRS